LLVFLKIFSRGRRYLNAIVLIFCGFSVLANMLTVEEAQDRELAAAQEAEEEAAALLQY